MFYDHAKERTFERSFVELLSNYLVFCGLFFQMMDKPRCRFLEFKFPSKYSDHQSFLINMVDNSGRLD